MVQPYDGSGWGMSAQPIGRRFITPIGATGFVLMESVDADHIFRLLACDVTRLVGLAPLRVFLNVIDQESLDQVFLAPPINMGGQPTSSFENRSPIVGPRGDLRIDWTDGDAATGFTIGLYGVLVPLGTVFYV